MKEIQDKLEQTRESRETQSKIDQREQEYREFVNQPHQDSSDHGVIQNSNHPSQDGFDSVTDSAVAEN